MKVGLKFLNLSLLIVTVITVIFIVELTSYLILQNKRDYNKYALINKKVYTQLDDNLGYVLKKNSIHQARKFHSDGSLIYDVTYRTDEFRRRTVGQEYLPLKSHLILFGCSYAYGEGLKDMDTLQDMLGKRMPQYNVYNYAVHGWGPQQMLALLEPGRLPQEVKSNKGVAVYYFIYDHFNRAVGTMGRPWIYGFPYYRLDKDGVVQRDGSFKTGRALITYFYYFLYAMVDKSNFCHLINFSLSSKLTLKDIQLTVEIIKKAKQLYEEQFNGKFYVLIYPFDENRDPYLNEFVSLLKENGIAVLNFPLPKNEKSDYVIKHDGHPNAKLNEYLTDNLVQVLN